MNNEKKTVMIAETAETTRAILTSAINQSEGFVVTASVNNGNDALAEAMKESPDVAIIDTMLPGIDGLSVLRHLRDSSPNTKVIITAEFVSRDTIMAASNMGASLFLPKPYSAKNVLDHMIDMFSDDGEDMTDEESRIYDRVTEILHEIGIPAHIKGHNYLRDAIIICIKDVQMIEAITKALYPAVAARNNTTDKRTERAMRHAIEVAMDRGDMDTIQKYFGYTISSVKGKPTNSEFIAMIADKVSAEIKKSKV